eukprot:CAMPEP_0195125776 /NCGR_PEP_ID=MMETSP0448-20130528/133592_1 /TAXON_ID=66468 /ORGANISM="Heterocapsa triquestra, Strain CCMP 448" /LENGTH=79 /DNA_ID=CAMNT_0040163433 /DNA_START=56 /DNA_END=295 /DNA_ORIENTATION=+
MERARRRSAPVSEESADFSETGSCKFGGADFSDSGSCTDAADFAGASCSCAGAEAFAGALGIALPAGAALASAACSRSL